MPFDGMTLRPYGSDAYGDWFWFPIMPQALKNTRIEKIKRVRTIGDAFNVMSIMVTETSSLHIKKKEESQLCSGLYLVPTPIGNLRDITLRALDVLIAADVIVCEDSRVTGKLLKAYDIRDKKKIVYNDHADDATKDHIINLASDKIVALVSDAGSPMISDPGYKLVRDALAQGGYVTALPGANAVLPAMQLSGLPSDQFAFAGFLPSKDKAIRDVLTQWQSVSYAVMFYKSPNRIEKTLAIIDDIMPERPLALVREISKLYEESIRGTAEDILKRLKEKPAKGEIVLIIGGATETDEDVDMDDLIVKALKAGQSLKDLSQSIAAVTGVKKKDVYNRALDIQKQL